MDNKFRIPRIVTNDKGGHFAHKQKGSRKDFYIENRNESLLIMTRPVMGFNNRLGTLIVTYPIEHPELK